MCMEDVKIGRALGYSGNPVSCPNNTTTKILSRRADRFSVRVCLIWAWAYNQPITGNIDPPTGNVAETLALSIPSGIQVGYNDTNGFVALAVLSRENPNATLLLSELGPAVWQELAVLNPVGLGVTVFATETYFERPLDKVL